MNLIITSFNSLNHDPKYFWSTQVYLFKKILSFSFVVFKNVIFYDKHIPHIQ